MSHRNLGVLAVLAWMAMITGCATSPLQSRDFQSTSLGRTGQEDAWKACKKVMKAQYGHIKVNDELYLIETDPEYDHDDAQSITANVLMRHIVKVRLRPYQGKYWVMVQSLRQRSDQETFSQFAHLRSSDDTPGATPIERDEVAGAQRRTVWTTVDRDRALEAALLAKIREELGIFTVR